MSRILPAFFVVLLLMTGCAPAPAPLNYPPISFAERTKINLDVSEIDIVDEYHATLQSPHVEHLFPITPEDALHQWVNDRLRARGTDKRMQFIIKDASVVEEKLPLTQGVKGAFTKEQAVRYTGNIALELRIYGDRAISVASTEVYATRTQTLGEGASLAQRDQLFYDLTRQMMQDVNAELEKNIQKYLSNHIQYQY